MMAPCVYDFMHTAIPCVTLHVYFVWLFHVDTVYGCFMYGLVCMALAHVTSCMCHKVQTDSSLKVIGHRPAGATGACRPGVKHKVAGARSLEAFITVLFWGNLRNGEASLRMHVVECQGWRPIHLLPASWEVAEVPPHSRKPRWNPGPWPQAQAWRGGLGARAVGERSSSLHLPIKFLLKV